VPISRQALRALARNWLWRRRASGRRGACTSQYGLYRLRGLLEWHCKALALVEASSLRNVRLYNGDARAVIEALPSGTLDGVYLLYPDPGRSGDITGAAFFPLKCWHVLPGSCIQARSFASQPISMTTQVGPWRKCCDRRTLAGPRRNQRIGKDPGRAGLERDMKRKRFARPEGLFISHSCVSNARAALSPNPGEPKELLDQIEQDHSPDCLFLLG